MVYGWYLVFMVLIIMWYVLRGPGLGVCYVVCYVLGAHKAFIVPVCSVA